MRLTALALTPASSAIMSAVQCVVSPGGSASVSATTRSATAGPSGATRDGCVLPRSSPSTPSAAKRSCQRHTQVFDLPVRRMISTVPIPSADKSTISARQTCFCGALRSLTSADKRARSVGETVKDIPVRIPQTRMRTTQWESHNELSCQAETNRIVAWPATDCGSSCPRSCAGEAGSSPPSHCSCSKDCALTATILQNRSLTRKPARLMPRQRLRSIPNPLSRNVL